MRYCTEHPNVFDFRLSVLRRPELCWKHPSIIFDDQGESISSERLELVLMW